MLRTCGHKRLGQVSVKYQCTKRIFIVNIDINSNKTQKISTYLCARIFFAFYSFSGLHFSDKVGENIFGIAVEGTFFGKLIKSYFR